ncbi:thioredoxin family protein [Pelobium sp.]|nr:thioredoxin family protein [Pelobium sp.]MDA9554947.1 thioredoxin family protein [Pelobium sp.]
MKLLCIFFLSLFLAGNTNTWEYDFSVAKEKASASHKSILINFSGSDWCGPCIRTHKEIFEKEEFVKYAQKNLVLVRADFPRLKKNQLPPEQLKKNNDLALKYNPDGDFPLTLLLNEKGEVIKEWKGFPNVSAAAFVKQVEDARK